MGLWGKVVGFMGPVKAGWFTYSAHDEAWSGDGHVLHVHPCGAMCNLHKRAGQGYYGKAQWDINNLLVWVKGWWPNLNGEERKWVYQGNEGKKRYWWRLACISLVIICAYFPNYWLALWHPLHNSDGADSSQALYSGLILGNWQKQRKIKRTENCPITVFNLPNPPDILIGLCEVMLHTVHSTVLHVYAHVKCSNTKGPMKLSDQNKNKKPYIKYKLFCFSSFPVKVAAEPGANVTLPCRLLDQDTEHYGAIGVHIKWTKLADDKADNENVLLSMGFHIKTYGSFEDRVFLETQDSEDGSIIITNVSMEDTGRYRCEMINGMIDETHEVSLEVTGVIGKTLLSCYIWQHSNIFMVLQH